MEFVIDQCSATLPPFELFWTCCKQPDKSFDVSVDSFDTNRDKFIDFDELKLMMQRLGSPQTHLALKAMIREVDEDRDNCISYREVERIARH